MWLGQFCLASKITAAFSVIQIIKWRQIVWDSQPGICSFQLGHVSSRVSWASSHGCRVSSSKKEQVSVHKMTACITSYDVAPVNSHMPSPESCVGGLPKGLHIGSHDKKKRFITVFPLALMIPVPLTWKKHQFPKKSPQVSFYHGINLKVYNLIICIKARCFLVASLVA